MAQASQNIQELTYLEKIELIRKYWQFAAICQFFLTFQKAYNFSEPFETERLESALATCDKKFIESILLNLMKNLPGQRFIHLPVLEIQIKKECERREFSHPFCDENSSDFFSLQISDQIKLIHALTEWQMEDFERVRSKVDEEDDCDEWRIESIGRDKKYNTYWLFDDNRLYKQKYQAPKKSKSVKKSKKNNGQEQATSVPADWELVCSTIQEWEEFPSQFDNSRNLDEQYLKDFLIEHVLPKVLPAIKSKEKQKKKEEQTMTFQPKRSSRLQAKELHRKEQEEEQRKIELLEAMEAREKDFKNSESEAIIQTIPNLNTREMRAKRRALLNEGRLEEVLELERDGIMKSVFRDSDCKSKSKSSKGSEESSEQGTKEDEELENTENGNHEGDGDNESEEEWYFKCVCGAEGQNRDDGLMMIACERCGIWQHVQCQDFYADNSQNPDLSSVFFLCQECLMNKPTTSVTLATNLSTQLDNSSSERTTPSNRTDITRESSQSVAQTLGYPLAALNLNGTDPNSPMSLDIKSISPNPE